MKLTDPAAPLLGIAIIFAVVSMIKPETRLGSLAVILVAIAVFIAKK